MLLVVLIGGQTRDHDAEGLAQRQGIVEIEAGQNLEGGLAHRALRFAEQVRLFAVHAQVGSVFELGGGALEGVLADEIDRTAQRGGRILRAR